MSNIPLELRLCLREGSIFYLQNRLHTSPESHFHIVVNADSLGETVLLFTIITSKVEKVKSKRRDCPQTLVELSPADLPGVLSVPSIVDCNTVTKVSLAEFSDRWKAKEVKSFGKDILLPLRRALRAAIHASILVDSELLALIKKAEEN